MNEQAVNIGLIVIGVTALIGFINGLITLGKHLKGNGKQEQDIVNKEFRSMIHNLDKTITKLDTTLNYMIDDNNNIKQDVKELRLDVEKLKKVTFIKDYD